MSEPLQETGAIAAARRAVHLVHRVERTPWQTAAYASSSSRTGLTSHASICSMSA
jgi:hypothetical protein